MLSTLKKINHILPNLLYSSLFSFFKLGAFFTLISYAQRLRRYNKQSTLRSEPKDQLSGQHFSAKPSSRIPHYHYGLVLYFHVYNFNFGRVVNASYYSVVYMLWPTLQRCYCYVTHEYNGG